MTVKLWKVKKSSVHGSGVFAIQDIKKNSKIIEYIGEKVLKAEGDKRSERRIKKFLDSKTDGSVYVFELNSKYDIDGSPLYNKARYINHSCAPNCVVDIIDDRIWIKSIKKIKKGEELNYDYGYEFNKDDFNDHVCRCGSKKCIGFIISSDDWNKYLKHVSNIIKKRKS
ncbi:SET domain-containing protein-lysine N-methyltransferase [Pelagibacterales bacterium SAG-MED32]|nr:SET domain-containing protein-lysine N-methyltransferase [Pelagibacterales bacterium SAG-MED32]